MYHRFRRILFEIVGALPAAAAGERYRDDSANDQQQHAENDAQRKAIDFHAH